MPNSLKKMVLLPRPRRIIPKVGGLVLPAQGRIVCNSDAAQLLPLALQVQGDLARLQQVHWDLGAGSGGMVRLVLRPGLPPQGYRLDIGDKGIELGPGPAGAPHGSRPAPAPAVVSAACPWAASRTIPIRGARVMLDVTRQGAHPRPCACRTAWLSGSST